MFKSIKVLRLCDGQEVVSELSDYCQKKGITSAIILGMVGSLKSGDLGTTRKDGSRGHDHDVCSGHLSILSGQGSLSEYEGESAFHIHMVLEDPLRPGQLIGGHLYKAVVWATAEIYIGELNYQLHREIDPMTGRVALCTTD